ncbi:hypothetical protein IV38_GL001532 [Lactobacillus selangorensis]|uniref:HTH lysR-type domain-containing protein n=1 Tax=Lactobacillus selangorensis TaxID=81857 RepID=A0A0R2FHI4_9LACO|nr:LysR family transcriptional regulator [Lactobacillus selangorensis]KRN28082.1 hypothetical protein IV38_GL001532 [Lactobacillus selangorensis]KRN31040.1 hypothetical protein IV40_GL001683 [Lactobacillus selangorensis]
MELATLQNYITIADLGNITAAAKLLHISQPALSRQLKDLETEMGTSLMERTNRGITLTDKGELLLNRARELVTLAEKTKQDVKTQNMIGGDLYIGAGETQGMRIVAMAVRQLQLKYPDVRVHLYSGNAEDLTSKMQSGFLDFSILTLPANHDNNHFIKLPHQDIWGVIVRQDDPLADLNVIKPQDLHNCKLIISSQHQVHDQFEAWLGAPLEKEQVVGTYNLIFNAALLVEQNFGTLVGFNNLIASTADNHLIFRPLAYFHAAQMNLVWKRGRELSPIAAAFLTEINQLIVTAKQP